MIKGIHHFSMKCNTKEEFENAVDFYLKILEFNLKYEWPDGIMIDSGNCMIEIFKSGDGIKSKGAIRHIALSTDNMNDIIAKIKKSGYNVFVEPKDIIINSVPALKAKIAFCYGPLGEEIEFFQEYVDVKK